MTGKYCMHCGGMVGEDGYSVDLTEDGGPALQDGFAKSLEGHARGYSEGGKVGDVFSSGAKVYRKEESGYSDAEPSENYKNWKSANPAKAKEYEADAGTANSYRPLSMEERFIQDGYLAMKRKGKK